MVVPRTAHREDEEREGCSHSHVYNPLVESSLEVVHDSSHPAKSQGQTAEVVGSVEDDSVMGGSGGQEHSL